MDVSEGKEKFIEQWGKIGPDWGINRCMAEIHALLLISAEPLDTEVIMRELNISRGSASTNLRELISWGLIFKKTKDGERKDYYTAEKDIWKAFRHIIIKRKKQELDPLKKTLSEVKNVNANTPEAKEFLRVVDEIKDYTEKSEQVLETLLKLDQNWLKNSLFKLMR